MFRCQRKIHRRIRGASPQLSQIPFWPEYDKKAGKDNPSGYNGLQKKSNRQGEFASLE